MRIAALLPVVAFSAGCPSLGSYECASMSDCDRAQAGVCLPDGACAYPDPGCESGQRRSPNAPTQAGECVEPGEATEATTATTMTATTAPATSSSDDGPPSCGWQKAISIDTTLISAQESLPGYPLLVALSDGDLEGDVFFFDEDGTHLPHDVERYGDGELLAWVRLSGWELGIPETIMIRGGDLAAPPTNQPTAVWADTFLGVWHMSPELSGVDDELVRDATARGEHGVTRGAMGADQVVPAIVGDGILFDGDDDRIEIAATFRGELENFTISGWVRDDSDGTIHAPFFARFNGDGLYPRCRKVADSGGVLCQVGVEGSDVLTSAQSGAENLPYETWGHLAMTFDASGSRVEIFLGGEQTGDGDGDPGLPEAGDQTVYFGFLDEFNTMLGMLDEMRIANTVLSDEWIRADARVQKNPDDVILAVGPAEPLDCP